MWWENSRAQSEISPPSICKVHCLLFLPLISTQSNTPGHSALWLLSESVLRFNPASLVPHMVKNLPAVQETQFDPWLRKIPWRREWQPTLVFLPGESHRGAWQTTVHEVSKSRTQLKPLSMHASTQKGLILGTEK